MDSAAPAPEAFGHGTAYRLAVEEELSGLLWSKYNTLLGHPEPNRRFLGEIPASLMRADVERLFDGRREYLCCEKTHGERFHFFCTTVQTSQGRRPVQACLGRDSAWRLVALPAPLHVYRDTLVDGELVAGLDGRTFFFVVFTTMASAGVAVHAQDFTERYQLTQAFLRALERAAAEPETEAPELVPPFRPLSKRHLPMAQFRELVERVRPALPYRCDGYLFTPAALAMQFGHHPLLLKLKDLTDNTVDFRLRLPAAGGPASRPWVRNRVTLPEGPACTRVELWTTERRAGGAYEELLYAIGYLTAAALRTMGDARSRPLAAGDLHERVVECRLDLATGLWWPEDVRNKLYPNILDTVQKTCQNIEENIRPEELFMEPHTSAPR